MSISLRTRIAIWSMLAVLAVAGVGWAQSPTATLSASRVTQGTEVTLRARGLDPDASFQFELRRPNGTTAVETIRSDARGNLTSDFVPEMEGMWIVRLRGAGVHSIFGLAVTPEAAGTDPAQPTDPVSDLVAAPPAEETPGAEPVEEPVGEAPEPPLPDEYRIDDGNVVGLLDGEEVWRLAFAPDSGPTGPLLEGENVLWVPHGLSLLAVDPATGFVAQRLPVPAPVTNLAAEGAEIVAGVTFETGSTAELRIVDGVPQDVVRFGTDVDAFAWLRNEADVDDPSARLRVDPTNPWLYVFAGRALARDVAGVEEGSGSRATVGSEPEAGTGEAEPAPIAPTDLYAEAIARGSTFFDLAGIGAELYAAGEASMANRALDAAFRDWADRGYDPDLLTDGALRAAYNFPLIHLQNALAEGDRSAASFWAPWAYRTAGGSVVESRRALREYATLLRDAGDREGAALWSARAGELLRTRVGAVVDRAFLGLAEAGWLAVLALVGAAVLLYATLMAKYWRPQTLHLRQRREAGRTLKPWARVVAVRFFSFTEKLVFVLLLAATLALGGLVTWDANAALPEVAGSGTLASAPSREFVAGLEGDPTRVAYVSGYAAQLSGDVEAAREAYRDAGAFAPAVNNLGALEEEERLYQRALELAPGLPAARYNLGRITSPSPFHETYRPGEPLLVTPSPADLKIAKAGPWRDAVARAFVAPWAELRTTTPGVPVWLWTAVVAAFFLIAIVFVVALLIPRPRVARNAPRTLPYHLLALLIPGTGLADELWGVLLLAPWSILVMDLVVQSTGGPSPTGLDFQVAVWTLGVVYAINLVAFVVELISYRRRMKALKKNDPELARRFGLRA